MNTSATRVASVEGMEIWKLSAGGVERFGVRMGGRRARAGQHPRRSPGRCWPVWCERLASPARTRSHPLGRTLISAGVSPGATVIVDP